MTKGMLDCGLLCYPTNGSLIAVEGRSWDAIYPHPNSVEVLRNGDCKGWQRLAPIPFTRGRPCVEYFRSRVFVLVDAANTSLSAGNLLISSPPGTDLIEQWISFNTFGPRFLDPTLLAACNNQLFFIGESLGSTQSSVKFRYTRSLF